MSQFQFCLVNIAANPGFLVQKVYTKTSNNRSTQGSKDKKQKKLNDFITIEFFLS